MSQGLCVLSVGVGVHLSSDEAGELRSCVGIDVQAPRFAPCGKDAGHQGGPVGRLSFAAKPLFQALGLDLPTFVCPRQEVGVSHEFQDLPVILLGVPRYGH